MASQKLLLLNSSLKHYSEKRRPLDGYIALANLLPARIVLPKSGSPDLEMHRELINRVDVAWTRAIKANPNFPRFYTSGDQAWHRYEIFYAIRETFRDLVKAVNAPGISRPTGNYTHVFGPTIRTFQTRPRQISLVGRGVYLSEDPYGVFLNILRESESIWDLRLCPICDGILLPRRKDQKACSPKCANAYRVRVHRKSSSKYEEDRRLRRKFKLKGVRGKERKVRDQLAEALSDAPANGKVIS